MQRKTQPGLNRNRCPDNLLIRAYLAGVANLTDIADQLIGPREQSEYSSSGFDFLERCTNSEAYSDLYKQFLAKPEIKQLLEETIERIVTIEIKRGETPTEASIPATEISSLTGLDRLMDLIAALGKTGFVQNSWRAGQNKPAVLTQLVQRLVPTAGDTIEAFSTAVRKAVAEKRFEMVRIAELGLVNPRWVSHCEAACGWSGYTEAVYWFIAHTGSRWERNLSEEQASEKENATGDEEKDSNKPQSSWQQIVKARTNLTSEQRASGLIDVKWFHQAYGAVDNDERWDAIEAAAKFLGYGQSHKKAARLADVLLGRTRKKEMIEQIRKKYLKESVRLLGLLPLPGDEKKRTTDIADRYAVLKEYERYAKKLSSLSKEPALQAMRLGLENLAVTAGYQDPMRLEWAVTAREVADLAKGPVKVSAGGVTLSMTLTDNAEVNVEYTKAGKLLKSLPAPVRKMPKVEELLERKKTLTRMVASTKKTLEQAMCAGEQFAGHELASLMGHAIVKPIIERLVIKVEKGMGYPQKAGSALQPCSGKAIPLKAGDRWTIAHPVDFLASGHWPDWQGECLRTERLQPFKQVFRELYVLTKSEKEDGLFSQRFAGHQVNETQAKALLASRGWSTREDLSKMFPGEKIVADITLSHGYSTPADAASPAVDKLEFHRKGDWKTVLLKDIPPIIFSETMRDLDLVVSVAHVGGVDPEATQSTIEMRSALLRETLQLLKIDNVKIDSKHAIIDGTYGKYSLHLGSGGVHKLPGGYLCVVPVPAGHRGRLFLPFADEDPRTAEVISKTLLLARDQEIQDPTILEQIARN